MFSRETAILVANLLLTTAAAMVMLGTLYPLFGEATGLGRISVGPPYFGFMFVLLMTPLVLIMPTGPFLRWGRGAPGTIARLVVGCGLTAIVITAAYAWLATEAMDWRGWLGGIGAVYLFTGVAAYVVKRWRSAPAGHRFTPEMAGMLLAHAGVAIFIAGAMLTTSLTVQRDIRAEPGQVYDVAGYSFRFDGIKHVAGPNWTARQGTVTVFRDGKELAVLHPQKRTYPRGQVQTEAGISKNIMHDLYVALGDQIDTTASGGEVWSMRVYYKPFVRWIWGGGVLMMLGGLVCAADRRFRRVGQKKKASRRQRQPVDTATPATEVGA